MKPLARRRFFGGLTIVTGVAAGTVPAFAQLQAEIHVPAAPPAPRVEVIPVLPAERVEIERWQSGHWRWNGHEHVWVEGHYVARPHPRAEWIAGLWEQRSRGWVYVEGHWN
ncbi:hypothetical protein BH10PSE6_BH10PSE6_05390 [soil metagenome]